MTNQGNKEGVFSIINTSLNTLKLTERPFHCTDIKRHTMYIKEDEGWQKEETDKKMRKLYQTILNKCFFTMDELITTQPNYKKYGTPEHESKTKMLIEINGSDNNRSCVINKLCEKTHIDKNKMTTVI
jgi:hypothetical protein